MPLDWVNWYVMFVHHTTILTFEAIGSGFDPEREVWGTCGWQMKLLGLDLSV